MKNIIRQILFCFFAISSMLLTSCGKTPSVFSEKSCIPPVEKIAYPVGIPASADDNKLPAIGPLGGWQLESPLPEPLETDYHPQIVTTLDKIWVLSLNGTKIFQYDKNTHNWKIYNTIDKYSVVPATLTLTKDGILWGLDIISEDFTSKNVFPLLSRYNEETDQFEFVEDEDGLLNQVSPISYRTDIVEDENGWLWFFGSLPENSNINLYSFNPSTKKAVMNISLSSPDWFPGASLAIAKDGTIWFYNGGQKKQLITYSASLQQIKPYWGPPNLSNIGDVWLLFFDQSERLWLDNKGWLDLNDPSTPIWYELIPSPVFITENGWFPSLGDGLPSRYGWNQPREISQSSNGWFWFTTQHGTIWLDPDKGEWCLFTTGSSPVVEDQNKNVWMVAFDKLYKYQLEK